jgi:hypothetical protein
VSASRRRLLTFLLLPVLALRVLLPAGFMPVAEGGEVRIGICPEGMHMPGHTSGDNDGQPEERRMGNCPFANAGSSAPPPQFLATHAMRVPAFRFDPPAAGDQPPASGPPRNAAARAPPLAS